MFNILVTAAGRRVALIDGFRRALTRLGVDGRVLAADVSSASAAFHAADAGYLVPPCSSPEFVPAVRELAREADVRLIVPTIDPELSVYARHRDLFDGDGVVVVVSSLETVRICNDKTLTHRWLVSNGFPTVRQGSVSEVPGDGWRFPLLVKPRRGSSSLNVAIVSDTDELIAATRDDEFVVQTIAPGVEYSVDILADRRGSCVCAVPRRRIEIRGGESSKGATERNEGLIALARRVCSALPGAFGPMTMQVFLDHEHDTANIIELNARFGGGFPLSYEAGADFPRWLIEEALGLPSSAEADRWQDGIVMLRYDAAVFRGRAEVGL